MLVISDKGQGIPALILPDVALRKRLSTVGTFGIEYKMMVAFCDKVYLNTGPDGMTAGLRMELYSVESLGLETGKTI